MSALNRLQATGSVRAATPAMAHDGAPAAASVGGYGWRRKREGTEWTVAW
jgi:hypothetical protein